MEGVPQAQPEMAPEAEGGFDREAIAADAAETARRYVAEKIDATLEAEERFVAMIDLMNELAEDNGNRFIVEAIAQKLTLEKAALELKTLEDRYSLVA